MSEERPESPDEVAKTSEEILRARVELMRARRHFAKVIALVTALPIAAACGPAHIRPHTPRERNYEIGAYDQAPESISEGSLWQDSSRGLFADFRATRVGDILTVAVDESPRAGSDATTEMDRESSMNWGVNNLFGLTSAITAAYPEMDPGQLLDIAGSSEFRGDGETSRSSRVRGEIAVRVKQQLPNGDLFIEGTKIIMVNDEELHIYISGVIRGEDIEPDNSIRSSLIADAQIEFTGRGALTENQERGWLSELLSAINPF